MPLLQNIFQHLCTPVGLIEEVRICGIQKQDGWYAAGFENVGMIGKNARRRALRRTLIRAWRGEARNLLLLAVFFHYEVFRLQANHGLTLFVPHHYINHD